MIKRLTRDRLQQLSNCGRSVVFNDRDGSFEIFSYCNIRNQWVSRYDNMSDDDMLTEFCSYEEVK